MFVEPLERREDAPVLVAVGHLSRSLSGQSINFGEPKPRVSSHFGKQRPTQKIAYGSLVMRAKVGGTGLWGT